MRRILLPVLMMLALSSVGRGPAHGQTSSTSLTGSWNVTVYGPDGSQAFLLVLLTCHPDGTVTAILPGFGDTAGAGTWVATGDGQFAMTTLHFDQNPPPSPTRNPLDGFLKLRYSVTVSGATLSGTVEGINLDLTGAVVKDFTSTLSGTQIAVEQIGAS